MKTLFFSFASFLSLIGNKYSSILVKKQKSNFKTLIDKTIKQTRVIKTISFSVAAGERKNSRKLVSPPPLPRSFSEDDIESESENEGKS